MFRVSQLAGFDASASTPGGGGGGGITKIQFLTSGTSASRPADWNDANNTVICIGGGSTGGGAYSAKNNVTLSATFNYGVGAGSSGTGTAGDTWCQGANFAGSACGAKGAAGHVGGQASAGIGDVKFSGGSSSNAPSVGGGGAAGPFGDGAAGAASPTNKGGGGGGANNGGTGNTDGTGGVNRLGTGAGAAGSITPGPALGQPGTNGGGGGGGDFYIDKSTPVHAYGGGAGSQDAIWTRTETSPGQLAGPGGGGGGTGGNGSTTTDGTDENGGAGALYGGGGGRKDVDAADGAGAQGIIILGWTT